MYTLAKCYVLFLKVCAGATTSTLTMLNKVQWYSRTDAALVGTRNLPIEVRYNMAQSDLRYRQRITGGILCGTIYVRGYSRGETGNYGGFVREI